MRGIFGAIADAIERKAQPLDFLPGFLLGGSETKSGASISYATALQVAAVLACVRVIAEDIASSPCKVFRPRTDMRGGADPARDMRLFRLLSLSPMGQMTAFEFWETLVAHLMLVGNAYIFKNVTGGGLYEMILLEPGKVTVHRNPDRTLWYEVMDDDGRVRAMPRGSIWHVRGLSWNGWMGMETVKLAREAIGLASVLEESHARLHKNGVKPSGVYSVEGNLSAEQYAQLTDWLKRSASAEAAGTPLILDRGAKWFSQQMSGVDQQHIETRQFQILEICRGLRVIPMMVGVTDKTATYASVEQMRIAHVTSSLAPMARRIETSAMLNLLTEEEQDKGLFIKFNLSAQMRGDYKSRQEGLQIQRRNGVINANEWRALEDMNPRDDDGGQQYIVEGNMAVQDGRDLVQIATGKNGTN